MPQDLAQVTGTITHQPPITLPPHAVVEVALVDVRRADAAAITLASQTVEGGDRQFPIPFAIAYDPDQIEPRFTYAIQARITVDGRLRFISTIRTPVITRGNPNPVQVVVSPVRSVLGVQQFP
jgi:uncharacterized lipoprotein YbaY